MNVDDYQNHTRLNVHRLTQIGLLFINLSLKLTRLAVSFNAKVVSCQFRVSNLANSLPTIDTPVPKIPLPT